MIFRTLVLVLAFMVANSTALADQQTYIVHIDKTKIRASIHSQDSSKPWFESIIDSISEASMQEDGEEDILAPQLLYAYETSMFGFAAHLSKKHLKYLNQVEGFLSAIPDELSTLHTTYSPQFLGLRSATKEAQYCTGGSLDPKLVHGKIVACERGINGRTEKGEEVKMAGGSGMILLNNEYQGEELFADPHILPATSLGASASKIVRSYSESVKKPTASISFMGTKFRDPAPVMAAFSSRGPSLVGSDVIKPDVTAPGVNILAAWPPKISPSFLKSDKRKVSFNILSGTSMSCPHVSGIAALLKSLHKDWSPAAIKSALMTTAYTLNNKGAPISDMAYNDSPLATPFVFGSGHVNPVSASDPGLVYDISTKDYFNYLCNINYTSSQIALLSRSNFVCSRKAFLQAGDLNYPSFAVLFGRSAFNASVTYRRVVTNVGKSRSSYAVKVEQPNGVSVSVEPRKLKFEKLGQKLSYNVTFLATGGGKVGGSSSFGSLIWVSDRYKVRSPIAITWQ
ncbi:Subtilisin-like protease [Vigna angularis]|uniref:Subtilisin-like protease n=1 Tax=Phaseolus angularis TaxID=3914 RepID=A0A8T0KU98_PHAAN|nr:Subtilisin-like protease [Vigna angularis]